MTAFRLLSLLALGATCHLIAADGEARHGLWLALQSLPTDYRAETELGGVTVENEDSYDSAGRLAFGYRGRFGGDVAFAVSAGLAFSSEKLDDDEIGGFGIVLEPGISFRLARQFELDVVVPLGFGGARIEPDEGDAETGSYGEIGLTVRPVFTFDNGLQLFADLGVLGRRQEFTLETGAGEADATIESSGFIAGLGVGYRF